MRLSRRSFLGAMALLPVLRGRRAAAEIPLRDDLQVLVIGAGVAGLAAASRLRELGLNVRVLEARSRVGGRIQTDRTTMGAVMEAGATFIHGTSHSTTGETNPIYALATHQGWGTTVFSTLDAQMRFEGSILSSWELGELFGLYSDFEDFALDRAASAGLEATLGTAMEDYIGLNGLDEMEEAALRAMVAFYISQAYGTDAAGLSLRYFQQDDEYGEGGNLLLPGGYDQLPTFLARELDIRTGETVESVDYGKPAVRVVTGQGEHQADFVLITVPLGVLKSGGITFTPGLPAPKQSAIDRLQMGAQNKVFLRFPARFWPEGFNWFAQIEMSSPGGLIFSNFEQAGTNPPILAAWYAGATATAKELLTDQQIVSEARAELQRTFPETEVPEPVSFLVTRWSADPFSRGSYPYVPGGASFNDMDVLSEPVAGRLFFAGDATNSRFYGTVHGAYLSGLREADRIRQEALRLSHRLIIRKEGPDRFQLSWESDPAFRYQLEKSSSLSTWSAHGGQLSGTGASMSTTESVQKGSPAFFRLRVE